MSKNKCDKCKTGLRFYSKESFPPMGQTVVTIQPGEAVAIDLPACVSKKGQAQVLANINLLFMPVPQYAVNITLDVLRDGVSITNGPQRYFDIASNSRAPPATLVFNGNFSKVDITTPKGGHTYSFIIRNESTSTIPVSIDNFAVSITA